MKKLNSKGFTLIELLAVITIMGILMLVAIPAVSRTIENSRRDTFMNTAKSYANAITNAVAADELLCLNSERLSARPTGYYYVTFNSHENSGKDLMEQGGKSSWGNAEVKGVVVIEKTVNGNRNSYNYYVIMGDAAGRGLGEHTSADGIKRMIPVDKLSRGDVKTSTSLKDFYGTDQTTEPGAPTKAKTDLAKTGANKATKDFEQCTVEM